MHYNVCREYDNKSNDCDVRDFKSSPARRSASECRHFLAYPSFSPHLAAIKISWRYIKRFKSCRVVTVGEKTAYYDSFTISVIRAPQCIIRTTSSDKTKRNPGYKWHLLVLKNISAVNLRKLFIFFAASGL